MGKIKVGGYVMVDICGAPIPGVVCSKNGYIATVLISDGVTYTCHTNKLTAIIPVKMGA